MRPVIVLLLALIQRSLWSSHSGTTKAGVAQGLAITGDCKTGTIKQNPYRHKSTYTVALHAVRNLNETFLETRQVFGDYLTATAGQRFDPPIHFKVVPYEYSELFTAIENGEVDFVYSNPGVFSCIGVQFGVTPLATVVKSLLVRNRVFDLDVSGGVIAVRYDNAQINTITDLKDKIIAAGGIVDFMGGQVQMNEMTQAGLSYVNDPKQVVFTNSPYDIVMGVLDGTFDVGFVRSNEIESTLDEKGRPVDPNLFKIIDPKSFVMDSGDMFPLLHSTEILPEWPFAALSIVPEDVQRSVHESLLNFGEYALMGQLQDCSIEFKGTNESEWWCNQTGISGEHLNPCNMPDEFLQLAAEASQLSTITHFRPARSYFRTRNILEAAGFLLQEESGYRCTRPDNLYDGITCPKGYFKRNIEGFNDGCKQLGLSCYGNANYSCFCKPCVQAFEVDVYPVLEGEEDAHLETSFDSSFLSCKKMEICGVVKQRQSITLRIFDNLRRDGADVLVIIHGGDQQRKLVPENLTSMYAYDFTITENHVGAQVVEVIVDGQPISQSPIRVMVVDADCDSQYGEGSNLVPNDEGICVCAENTYDIAGQCVTSLGFFLIIVSALFAAVGIMLFFYLGYKKNQSDSIWQINVEELHFNEPPEVIGCGAFGVVILGQYRGTKVAVKRVLPPAKMLTGRRLSITSAPSDDEDGITEIAADNEANPHSPQGMVSMASKETTVTRNVKFGGHPTRRVDIESQLHKSKSGSIKLRNTKSGSNKDWERFVMKNHSHVDVFRLLDAATTSVHGSDNESDESSSRSPTCLRFLPLWLRCDSQAQRVTEFVSEMRMLSRLRHPCITTVMGAVVSSTVDPMLVMEYMEYGSLHDLLHNETMSPGGEIILQILRDIVQGIQFLHASRPPILHGDLKAKNILVDSRFRAKVADFGFSGFKSTKQRSVLYGTPFYMAPEYLKRQSEYTTFCDIYSLAMIFYEIYAKAGPFEGQDPRKILPKICHPRHNKRPPIPESCPPKVVDMMTKCWSANPFFRPSAKDVDYVLVAMHPEDMEPLATSKKDSVWDNVKRKPTSLYDVFPKHIADALNAGKKVEAESHEIVTVVFSDIVGFTSISQQCTPLKVANMLDRLYQAFDKLAHEHHIFKVETIGDAYMGVTNLDGSEHDTHVKQVAEYAQDAIRAASQIRIDEDDPSKGFVRIRVGFHCGPVVSNVIGSLNPRYGLFGDTVNTALSMESNSMPGKIHCSFAAAQLLQSQAPDITVKLRGIVKIQGKGKMKTYWVGDDILVYNTPESSLMTPQTMDASTDEQTDDDLSDEEDEDVLPDDFDDEKYVLQNNGLDSVAKEKQVMRTLVTQDTEMSESSSSDYGRDHFVSVHIQSQHGVSAAKVGMDGYVEEVAEVAAC